jgi:UDP-N-acetylmuramate--alanine ligase
MHIYFSGIGGVGVGPLAEIARDAGYHVTGSDIAPSLMTEKLEKKGIEFSLNQDGQFLKDIHEKTPIDWFTYTSSLPDDHPELVLARELGIKTSKRGELLAHIIKESGKKLIAVSGTHGKTTTTSMAVWVFKQLGIPVSYSIGTTLSFGPSGHFDKDSQYFVYECDEFDRNFLDFWPDLSLITSIDHDHTDSYPTKSEYIEAFQQFGNQSKEVITWNNYHPELFSEHPDAWILDETLSINVPGEHNRRNATLVVKAFEKLGFEQNIIPLIESFPGVDRRFEKLADNLYSDYGHHPVEIVSTLQLARELSSDVVLVYQPHQNIRQHEIKNQYNSQFVDAETIYWTPTYLTREDPKLAILTPEELVAGLVNKQDVIIAELDDNLWNKLQSARNEGKLVLGMGAGTIDGWLRGKLAADQA